MTNEPLDLAALRALARQAKLSYDHAIEDDVVFWEQTFIANSKNDIPLLITGLLAVCAEVDLLIAEVDKLTAEVARLTWP